MRNRVKDVIKENGVRNSEKKWGPHSQQVRTSVRHTTTGKSPIEKFKCLPLLRQVRIWKGQLTHYPNFPERGSLSKTEEAPNYVLLFPQSPSFSSSWFQAWDNKLSFGQGHRTFYLQLHICICIYKFVYKLQICICNYKELPLGGERLPRFNASLAKPSQPVLVSVLME